MRLSLHTDYALRTLMYLAVQDGHASIGAIAEAYGISKNHLMKIAPRLVAEGFLEAVRGRSGGIRLARPPEAINIGAVARAMEETGGFVECFNAATNSCVITPACALRPILAGGLEAFFAHLDGFTLADIIGDTNGLQNHLMARP